MVSSRWLMNLLAVKSRERDKAVDDDGCATPDISENHKKTRKRRGAKTKDVPVELSAEKSPRVGLGSVGCNTDDNQQQQQQQQQHRQHHHHDCMRPKGGGGVMKGGKSFSSTQQQWGVGGGGIDSNGNSVRAADGTPSSLQPSDQQYLFPVIYPLSSHTNSHRSSSHLSPKVSHKIQSNKQSQQQQQQKQHANSQKCQNCKLPNVTTVDKVDNMDDTCSICGKGNFTVVPYVLRGLPLTSSKEESAAIAIQTAFRSYLARRALHTLRGLAKLQQVGWCDHKGTWDDIRAALQSKHEGALKRERARAYAFSYQLWKPGGGGASLSYLDCHPDRGGWGWSWLERWMSTAEPCRSSTSSRSSPGDGGGGGYVENLSKVVDGVPRSIKLLQQTQAPETPTSSSLASSEQLPDLGKCKSCKRRITARPGSQAVSPGQHRDLCNICTPTVSSAAKTIASLQLSPKSGNLPFQSTLRSPSLAAHGAGLSLEQSMLSVRNHHHTNGNANGHGGGGGGHGMERASCLMSSSHNGHEMASKLKASACHVASLDLGNSGSSNGNHSKLATSAIGSDKRRLSLDDSHRLPAAARLMRKSDGPRLRGNFQDATPSSNGNGRPSSAPQQTPALTRANSSPANTAGPESSIGSIRRSSMPAGGSATPHRGAPISTQDRAADRHWLLSRSGSSSWKLDSQAGPSDRRDQRNSISHELAAASGANGNETAAMSKTHVDSKTGRSSMDSKRAAVVSDRADAQKQSMSAGECSQLGGGGDSSRRRSFPRDQRT